MTAMKKWPEPYQRSSPTHKARLVAGAYRQAAQAYEEIATVLRDAFLGIDRRLVAFDSPATLAAIDKALAALPDTHTVEQLDNRFSDYGEAWHRPQPEHYDDDDYVDSKTAGRILAYDPGYISRLRADGRLKGTWNDAHNGGSGKPGGRGAFFYRVGDLREFALTHTRRVTKKTPPLENI